jgi:hypothetical protein
MGSKEEDWTSSFNHLDFRPYQYNMLKTDYLSKQRNIEICS